MSVMAERASASALVFSSRVASARREARIPGSFAASGPAARISRACRTIAFVASIGSILYSTPLIFRSAIRDLRVPVGGPEDPRPLGCGLCLGVGGRGQDEAPVGRAALARAGIHD